MRLLLIALIAAGSGLSGMTSGVSKWLDSLHKPAKPATFFSPADCPVMSCALNTASKSIHSPEPMNWATSLSSPMVAAIRLS